MHKIKLLAILPLLALFSCKKPALDYLNFTIHDGIGPYSSAVEFENATNVAGSYDTQNDTTAVSLQIGTSNYDQVEVFQLYFLSTPTSDMTFNIGTDALVGLLFHPSDPTQAVQYMATSGTLEIELLELGNDHVANLKGRFDVYMTNPQNPGTPFHVTGEFSNLGNF